MESPTGFDLNHAIGNWRQHLGQSPSYRPENLEELESHLRDSVATLTGKGLSEEEAFLIAARRTGSAQSLAPEYAKVNGREVWLHRLLWMLVGVQAWQLITALAGALSQAGGQLLILNFVQPDAAAAGSGTWTPYSPLTILSSALFFFTNIIAVVAIIAVARWMIRRRDAETPQWAGNLRRLVALGVCFCLAVAFANMIRLGGPLWMVRNMGPTTYSDIALSLSISTALLNAVKTMALVAVTVVVARRLLRRAPATTYP